jgi:hypothetical protein
MEAHRPLVLDSYCTDLIARLRAAGRDERLATGQLYLDAADALQSLSGPSREDVIEECAMVAEDEWITTNSLCRSKAAGDIAKAIRALKCSSATQREGEKK